MNYTLFTVIGREADDEKFQRLSDFVANNMDSLGCEIEDNFIEGSLDLSYQEKSMKFIAEIKTANESFANKLKEKMEECGISEIRMIGVVKNI